MLYRASTKDVGVGRVSRRHGHLVVVMQYYPRFLPKTAIDEYLRCLAPDRGLFAEFKARERKIKDHDRVFREINYETRFEISGEGMDHLGRLAELSQSKDVYLICHCQAVECCHGDLLLLVAKHQFGARIANLRKEYPIFEQKLKGNRPRD